MAGIGFLVPDLPLLTRAALLTLSVAIGVLAVLLRERLRSLFTSSARRVHRGRRLILRVTVVIAALCIPVAFIPTFDRADGSGDESTTRSPVHQEDSSDGSALSVSTEINGLTVSSGVANVTAGSTRYGKDTRASYDQVIKVQLYFRNASQRPVDITPVLGFSSGRGTHQDIRWTVSSNGRHATVGNAVRLDRADASLTFIEGSVVWRRADPARQSAHIDTTLSEAQVFAPAGPLETVEPNADHAATVTALFRVTIHGAELSLLGAAADVGSRPVPQPHVVSGRALDVSITARNSGNAVQEGVSVEILMPPGFRIQQASLVTTGPTNAAPSVRPTATGESVILDIGRLAPGQEGGAAFTLSVAARARDEGYAVQAFMRTSAYEGAVTSALHVTVD